MTVKVEVTFGNNAKVFSELASLSGAIFVTIQITCLRVILVDVLYEVSSPGVHTDIEDHTCPKVYFTAKFDKQEEKKTFILILNKCLYSLKPCKLIFIKCFALSLHCVWDILICRGSCFS